MGSPKMPDTKMMRQSSDLLRPQPARLAMAFLALVLSICPADAQDRYRVVQDENFRREPRPDGRRLASIMEDSEVSGDTVRSGWVRVTVQGWIWSRSLRGINSSGFDHEVSASSGENLRAFPNGDVIARLERGFRLREEARDGAWIRVSRTGWMWGRSLETVSGNDAVEQLEVPGAPAMSTEATPASPAQSSPPPSAGGDAPNLDRAVTVADRCYAACRTATPPPRLHRMHRCGSWRGRASGFGCRRRAGCTRATCVPCRATCWLG